MLRLQKNGQLSTLAWLPGAVATAELLVAGMQTRKQATEALLPDPVATARARVSNAVALAPLPVETATDFLSKLSHVAVPDWVIGTPPADTHRFGVPQAWPVRRALAARSQGMSVVAADESLVAVLSHQLINDLAVIVGAASTLIEHPSVGIEKRQKLLEAIERHGYVAARLVETMARGGPGDLDVLYAF